MVSFRPHVPNAQNRKRKNQRRKNQGQAFHGSSGAMSRDAKRTRALRQGLALVSYVSAMNMEFTTVVRSRHLWRHTAVIAKTGGVRNFRTSLNLRVPVAFVYGPARWVCGGDQKPMIGSVFEFLRRRRLFFTAMLVVAMIAGQGGAFAHCPDLASSETEHHHDSEMEQEHAGSAFQDHAAKATPIHDHQDRSSSDKRVNMCVGAALAIVAQPTSDAPIDFVLLHSTLECQAASGRSIEPLPEPPRA